jgi:hypothetical protein
VELIDASCKEAKADLSKEEEAQKDVVHQQDESDLSDESLSSSESEKASLSSSTSISSVPSPVSTAPTCPSLAGSSLSAHVTRSISITGLPSLEEPDAGAEACHPRLPPSEGHGPSGNEGGQREEANFQRRRSMASARAAKEPHRPPYQSSPSTASESAKHPAVTQPSVSPISPPLLDRIHPGIASRRNLNTTSTSTFASGAPNHERSHAHSATMPTFFHGAPNRECSCVPQTASAITFGNSVTYYSDHRPPISARYFSAGPARKPREQYPVPVYMAETPAGWTHELEEGGREEAESYCWKAPETEAERQREGTQPLRDISTNTADLNDLASRQLLQERLNHIEVLEGCLVELDPFHSSLGERIKRLEDAFRSLRESEVHING